MKVKFGQIKGRWMNEMRMYVNINARTPKANKRIGYIGEYYYLQQLVFYDFETMDMYKSDGGLWIESDNNLRTGKNINVE